MVVELVAGDARVVVDPAAGARATSWTVAGLQLLGGADGDGATAPTGYGMYLMAPWAGRLRDNVLVAGGTRHPMPAGDSGWALHGTVLDATWEVEQADSTSTTLSVPLAGPWPWPGRVRATWSLSAHSLTTTLEVSAAGGRFPASAGWHPWFRRRLARGADVRVELPGATMLERGADHLPTGRLLSPRPPGPYDDAFPLPDGQAALEWPGALRLECRTDCAYVVLFDERPGAVCLEPQTAPPDGPNTCPDVVAPGHPLLATSTWTWSPA